MKTIPLISTAITCFLILNASIYGGTMQEWTSKIPTEIMGWKVVDKDESYTPQTIFKHINGGAELYLAYDFKEAFIRTYTDNNKNQIIIDIYDMGSANDAYGVFTSEQEYPEAGIGQGSEYNSGLLRFWQDHYFVSIQFVGEEEHVKQIQFKIAEEVAAKINSVGPVPFLLTIIPDDYLVRSNRIKFFHTQMLLNKHYFVAHDNILNLNKKTDCLMIEFPENDSDSTYLLIINYPNVNECDSAYFQFLKIYLPEAQGMEYLKTENGRWVMVKKNGCFLIIIFDALNLQKGKNIIAKLKIKEG